MTGTVLVVGVGNELLGDEGLGVHVVRALALRQDSLPASVAVIDAGTALFDAASEIARFSRVIIVDAAHADGAPGTVYRIEDASELMEPAGSTGTISSTSGTSPTCSAASESSDSSQSSSR